jgi:hypothetical protein
MKVLTAFRLADLVDGDDVGVIQRGGGAALAEEPFDHGRVGRRFRRHDFDRDAPVELRIHGRIHFAHPAVSKHGLDAVATECRAHHQRDS